MDAKLKQCGSLCERLLAAAALAQDVQETDFSRAGR
jgi:hypothetical protein